MNYKRILHSVHIPIRYVPGATPKKPFSGLMALSCPLPSNFIHAMSSPTHSTLYPGSDGHIMARFVLPQALGNAAAIYLLCPAEFVMPRICEDKSHEHMIQQMPKKQIIYNLQVAYKPNPSSLSLPSSIVLIFKQMRWAGHVAHMKETRNALQNG
jgi:hypothetical protein